MLLHTSCKTRLASLITGLFVMTTLSASAAVSPSELPLLSITDLSYEGGIRIPSGEFGVSSANYSVGAIAYNAVNNSMFIVGHTYEQAIAEFNLPTFIKSESMTSLSMAGNPRQVFSRVMDRVSGGNPQALDSIGGIALLNGTNGPELLVNAYEYYDAPGANTQTTLAVRNPLNLAASTINGYFTFQGGAGHTSGWMSPIPTEWQTILGGTYITGQSSGLPIISRLSVGPSAFVFNPNAIVGNSAVPNPVPTIKLLDFSLTNPLASDLSNNSRTNNLWTHLSRVIYGIIVPGTRTYITVGNSGGHNSGVCYKCVQSNGNLSGGYDAPDIGDYYHYYWLWDVNDLVRVKLGTMASYDVRPYAYGVFSTPFSNPNEPKSTPLGGGSYDPNSGILYLSIKGADRDQGEYSNPPVIVAYKFHPAQGSVNLPSKPKALRIR